MLTLNDGRSELWQWDTGRTLAVDADCSQVHFSNKVFGRSIDVDVADGVAIIPDILLQTDKDLNVLAFVGTAENGYTKISKTFKVNRRNKPSDYVFTPQEQITLKDATAILEDAKDVANGAMETAKKAEASADNAAKIADEMTMLAYQVEQNADTATKAKADALTAQTKAEEARNAAETAKTSAETAKGKAESAKTAAETDRTAAETAKVKAETAQSKAEAAAASAQRNAEQAATDAKTATDAKVAAAGSADAAAGSAIAAENSATAAARSEQAAAASEVKAAESENAAKASEQAAAESAQAALESKTAAATSEVNAAASAKKAQDVSDSLPEDYTTAVNEIATLKQQVENITPDDSTVGEKPWSSKNIVDMLCQPLEESGNPVQCYPVENYPLGVKAKWEPVQEGSGDPSPDNIRPIKGRDSVMVERCGENLIDSDRITEVSAAYGLTAQYVSGKITISGIYSRPSASASFSFMYLSYKLPPTTKFTYLDLKTSGCILRGIRFTDAKRNKIAIDISVLTIGEKIEISFYLIAYVDTTAPTTYTPYIGQTNTLTLPETVYGGEVDAVSGYGNENAKIITLDGNELKFRLYNNVFYNLPPHSAPGISAQANIRCSHFDAKFFGVNANYGFCFLSKPDIDSLFASADDLNAYLAAQYAAGTPVQLCYKLEEPVPFTATGTQPIHALSGVNTILTDADTLTVKGREDPKHTITELKNAIISLGGNV